MSNKSSKKTILHSKSHFIGCYYEEQIIHFIMRINSQIVSVSCLFNIFFNKYIKPLYCTLKCKWPHMQNKRPTRLCRLCNCMKSSGPSLYNFGFLSPKLAFGSSLLLFNFPFLIIYASFHSPQDSHCPHQNYCNKAAFKVFITLLL